MRAVELANITLRENTPIDYGWLNHLRRTYTDNELLDWCKGNVECFAPNNTSKKLITMAAKILMNDLF